MIGGRFNQCRQIKGYKATKMEGFSDGLTKFNL